MCAPPAPRRLGRAAAAHPVRGPRRQPRTTRRFCLVQDPQRSATSPRDRALGRHSSRAGRVSRGDSGSSLKAPCRRRRVRHLTLRCCSQTLPTVVWRPRGVRCNLTGRCERPARIRAGVCCRTRALDRCSDYTRSMLHESVRRARLISRTLDRQSNGDEWSRRGCPRRSVADCCARPSGHSGRLALIHVSSKRTISPRVHRPISRRGQDQGGWISTNVSPR